MDRKRLLEALIIVAVAGCSDSSTIDPTTRRALDATQAQCKQASADVETLRKQGLAAPDLSALQLRLDSMAAEIAALKMRAATGAKIPHLIATETGADFGPFAGWDRYYESQVGAYVTLGPQVFYYSTKDCTGDPIVDPFPLLGGGVPEYCIGPNMHIYQIKNRVQFFALSSAGRTTEGAVKCYPELPSNFPKQGHGIMETGFSGTAIGMPDLSIELR